MFSNLESMHSRTGTLTIKLNVYEEEPGWIEHEIISINSIGENKQKDIDWFKEDWRAIGRELISDEDLPIGKHIVKGYLECYEIDSLDHGKDFDSTFVVEEINKGKE